MATHLHNKIGHDDSQRNQICIFAMSIIICIFATALQTAVHTRPPQLTNFCKGKIIPQLEAKFKIAIFKINITFEIKIWDSLHVKHGI